MKLRASWAIIIIIIGQSGVYVSAPIGSWTSTSNTDPVALAAAEKKCDDAAAKYRAKLPAASPTIDSTKPNLNWSIEAKCIQKT